MSSGPPTGTSTRKRNPLGLLLETADKMDDHSASTQSAALAFYSVFSIAPVLVVVIAIAGAAFGADTVRGEIVRQFGDLMGPGAAGAIETLLLAAAKREGSGIANALGIATLLLGTTAVFVQLQEALNRIWDVAPRPGSMIGSLLRKRFVSLTLVMGIGFLLLVSLALSAAISAAQGYLTQRLPLPLAIVSAANNVLGFLVVALVIALIYRVLPDARVEWSDVALGSVMTSALISLGKWLIGFYLGRTSVVTPYGAAGSFVLILLWVYYVSWILLFGAELTRAHARIYRSARVEPEPGAMKVVTPDAP